MRQFSLKKKGSDTLQVPADHINVEFEREFSLWNKENLLISCVIDDKLITVIAEDTELIGLHANRMWLCLLLVLQPMGGNIPVFICKIVGHKLCHSEMQINRPATVECPAGDTKPDRGGVLALGALKLAIVRDGSETLGLTSATGLGVQNCSWRHGCQHIWIVDVIRRF